MEQKKVKAYMIGNAHLDPVWLWRWQDGFQAAKATFRSVLDRMKEFPDFVFTGSSVCYYEWIEQNDAEMFEEIRARVREGRWVICGGWWIEPDCNIPGGESFARQGLLGQRYLREKFGVTARTGYNVDSFGHNGSLPQILRKSGMARYVFMRPGRNEKGLPAGLFTWKSADGSAVTAYRIPYEYCTWGKELGPHIRRCAGDLKEPEKELMIFYGVGDHGGGPTVENIRNIRALNDSDGYPELVMASPEDYFDAVRSSRRVLPVVEGDLLHHSSGCYSAHSGVKRWNRRAENRLLAAEKLSAASRFLTGQAYPAEEYRKAWKDVLFNQFHDILAGTCIESAYEDVRESYGEALHLAAEGMNLAAQAVSWKIGIEPEAGARPLVVFNPHGFACRAEIGLETEAVPEGTVLEDDAGNPVPFQRVDSEASVSGREKIVFVADLPSLGYRTYRLRKTDAAAAPLPVRGRGLGFENAFYRASFDETSGLLRSLVEKKSGGELLRAPAARPAVIADASDTWSHGVRRFDREEGSFALRSIRRVEDGPVRTVIRVESGYQASSLAQDFIFYPSLPQIEVRAAVDWHERHRMLKLRFPLRLNYCKINAEIPFGYADRAADADEYPMQQWVDATGAVPGNDAAAVGLSILNDGKYSYDAEGDTVSVTVLRSPAYAHHIPLKLDPHKPVAYMDQGVQRFTYALYPHCGGWETAGTVRRAMLLNQKPFGLFETFHQGPLPQALSFLQIDCPHVVLTALKLAEDGSGDLILRAYESARTAAKAVITLPVLGRTISCGFGPGEIKTFRIPADAGLPAAEVDLTET